MNLEDFKKAKIVEMKAQNKDAVAALNVVINKIMLAGIEKKAAGQTLSEAEIVSLLQKSVKELEEERDAFKNAGRTESVESLDRQVEAVKKYLPQLLSEQEIKEIIDGLEDKSLPSVMRHFKSEYAGKCDMALVNKVVRSL